MPKQVRTALLAAAALLTALSPLAAAENPHQETVARIMERQAEAAPVSGPRFVQPRRAVRRRGPATSVAKAPAGTASPSARPAAGEPQTLGVNFLGASLADTNTFPPDTMGAVGPTQFLVAVNGRVRSFSKATGLADGGLNADLDTFFASVRNAQPTNSPRVRYDRLSGRWFLTAISAGASFSNNRILIAMSSSGSISGGTVWTFYFFEHDLDAPTGDTNLYFDDNTLGMDSNALLIGGNLFDSVGAFQGTSVHAVRKSALISGIGGDLAGSAGVVAYRNLTGTPGGAGPYTPQGVDSLSAASSTASWIIGVNNVLPVTSSLVLLKLTYSAPGAWPPTGISGNMLLAVPTTALPLTVPHQGNIGGTDGELDAVDDRLFDAKLRGGHVWTAHNIAVDATGAGSDTGDRDGARWYEIDVSGGSPALVQSGTLYDPAASNPRFYWIPSIMVSGQGHAAIGASAAGATEFVNAVTAGRFASDPAGTLQSPLLFTASATAYNPAVDPGPARRWGDYSYTSLDPNDDMTMWTIQEYCNATDSYGVRAVQLIAPAPATPASADPPTIASGQASVSVVVTGDSAAGSGFFDPGAGYPNRLAATVPGGVAVNGVTVTSPTSVTLDLNTVGAPFGSRTVTITNPDGQSRTSTAAILTLDAGGPGPTVAAISPASGDAAAGTGGADHRNRLRRRRGRDDRRHRRDRRERDGLDRRGRDDAGALAGHVERRRADEPRHSERNPLRGMVRRLPRRTPGRHVSLRRRKDLPRRHHGRMHGGQLLPQRRGHPGPDGGFSVEVEIRGVSRPAGVRERVRRRHVSLAFRRLDRGAVHARDHRRMQRFAAPLLPRQPGHAGADGGVSPEGLARLELLAAQLHRPRLHRRALCGRRVRSVDRGPLRARHHRGMRRRTVLSGRPEHARADGGVPGQDLLASVAAWRQPFIAGQDERPVTAGLRPALPTDAGLPLVVGSW